MPDIETTISFPLRDDERKKALAALESLRKAQAETAKSVLDGSKAYDVAIREVKEYEKQQKSLEKTLKGSSLDKQAKELLQWKDAAEKAKYEAIALDARLQDLDEQFGKVSNQIGQSGDIASGLSQAGGALSTIPGLGGVGQAAGAGTAVFDLIEAVPRLNVALKGVPDILQKAALSSGGLTSAIATGLTPALGATGASVAALAIPLAAIAAAAAAVTLAFKQYNDAAEKQRQILEANISAISEVNQSIAGGLTSEDATAQLDQLRAAREAETQTLGTLQGSYNQLTGELKDTFGILSGPITAGIQAFDSREQQLVDSINESQSALTNYDAQIRLLEQALAEGSLTANDAKIAEEELTTQRLDDIAQLESQRQQSLDRIMQLETQANEARANYAEQNLDRAADEALASKQALETQALDEQFANEDRIRANQEFQDSLLAIEQQGQDKIKSLRADLGSLAGGRIKAISEAETKGNADISKLQKEFMSDSLKTVEKFQDNEKKIQQRGQIDRLRLLQDLNDSLADAQRDNNVIAFLEAQRNGEKQLQRESQDAGLEAKQRADDFARENEERRNALAQRIADIQVNIEKEREQINLQFAERQAAIQKSIADEEAAIQERTRAAIEANNKQAENEARNAERELLRENLKAQQQEQRDALVEARRVREHQEQLARIDQQAQAQQRALQGVISQLGTLQAQAAAQRSNIGTVSGQGSFGAGIGQSYTIGSNSIRIGGNSLRAFAEGGVADKPTLGLLGERSGYGDLVLPFKKSDGLPVGARGSGQNRGMINVTYSPIFQTTIGDIASKGEVSEALREYALQHGQAQIAMLERMLNP